jgi:hypothetical protein
MTNQLVAEAAALPDLDEYAGMSATDIAHAVINWPEGSEDQIRAIAALRQRAPGRGHNNPPLKEALDEELAAHRARVIQLVERAETSVLIRGDETSATKMIDLVRQMKEQHDELNKERLARTAPYRDAVKLINDTYEGLKLRLSLAIGGTSGRDGCVGQLTKWDDDKKAAAEAKEAEGKSSVAAELAAIRARDEAERLSRRAEAIRHEPTRSQLGQTTRRKVIRFAVEDIRKRIAAILRSPRRKALELYIDQMTEQDLRALGVAAIEQGVVMPGVRAWVEEGGVSVRR